MGEPNNCTVNSEHTHWVGTALEKAGRFLTRPASLFLTDGVRFIRPIKPGVGEQASTYTREVGYRVLYGAKAIVLLALNLILSPLELLGCCMRFTSTQFFRKEIVWIRPEQELSNEPKSEASPFQKQIKVATFNIGAMPSFIGVHNNCGEMDRARQIGIADLISKMDDDVICIQEAFENFGPIAERVKEKFPHILYDVARNHHFRLGSGLVILSRHPIKTFSYQRHPCAGGLDDMARKGVLAATITLPGGRPFLIFNTHLNAGAPRSEQFPDAARNYRATQLFAMQNFIAEYAANYLDADVKPIVMGAGDLNIGPTEKHKKSEENPTKLDLEWFDTSRSKITGKASQFQEIMDQEYYDTVTNLFFEKQWKVAIYKKEDLEKQVKKFDQASATTVATSIEKDDPLIEINNKKRPVLGVQQLDHVFAIRDEVFGNKKSSIAKTKLHSIEVQNILDNPVSDHAPLHVTYTLE